MVANVRILFRIESVPEAPPFRLTVVDERHLPPVAESPVRWGLGVEN